MADCADAIFSGCAKDDNACCDRAVKAVVATKALPAACQNPSVYPCGMVTEQTGLSDSERRYWENTCWASLRQTDTACGNAQTHLEDLANQGEQAITQEQQQERQENLIRRQNALNRSQSWQANHQSYIAQPFGNSTLIRPCP